MKPDDTKNHDNKDRGDRTPHPTGTVPSWAEDLDIDIIFLDIDTK